MNMNSNTNPLIKPTYTITQKVIGATAAAIACIAFASPAAAQALAPVTATSNIMRDTIVGVCLAVMTGAWGVAGMKMAFAGATARDVQGPLIGGTLAGGAAAMAAAFIA